MRVNTIAGTGNVINADVKKVVFVVRLNWLAIPEATGMKKIQG
jgi:hypothetical protein